MQLTDEQRQKVSDWIELGMKLSEIQDRLGSELGLRMTYMDVRLLVDDLKLTPKDIQQEEPKRPDDPAADKPVNEGGDLLADEPVAPAGSGKVSVRVDQVMRPGAMVSGKATFSDGQTADWYLDQFGRFGLVPAQQGYRPPQEDVAELQVLLDRELAKMGY